MLRVMEEEGMALLEGLILASQNAVRANALVEELVGEPSERMLTSLSSVRNLLHKRDAFA